MTRDMDYKLLSCKTLSEFMTMYFGLGFQEKLSVFTEEVTIKKDSYLYRIRRTDGIKNPNDPIEWEPVPVNLAKQGRFNAEGESVLYVASAPDTLERELGLREGEEYYLAKYICKKSFRVGSFLGFNSQVNKLIHKITMAVLKSEDLTETENKLIDEYYELVKNRNLFGLSLDMLSPLYIHKMLPNLYKMTNKLAKLAFKKFECGIRYASVYSPMELSGTPQIITLAGMEYGNYALTQKGYGNIKFVSVEKKSACKPQGLEIMISECMKKEKFE